MNIQFVKKSSNSKTGAIPTTTSDRKTCPSSCPFIGVNGCYAEAGYYTRMNWDKVSSGERGDLFPTFISNIKKIKAGQLWLLHPFQVWARPRWALGEHHLGEHLRCEQQQRRVTVSLWVLYCTV